MATERGTWRHDAFGVWMVVWSWGPAVAALGLFARHPGPLAYVAAVLVIAARQHALFVVAHESFHKTVFRNAWLNRFAGGWLAAYPIVIPWTGARAGHLEHHRKVGTVEDPDRYAWFWRKSDRAAFVLHMCATATGLPFVLRMARLVVGLPPARPRAGVVAPAAFKADRSDQLRIVVAHVVLLGIFAATLGWQWYFLLWLWPSISIRLVLDETRQFLEHRGGLMHVYHAGPLERFFLGPFNFHLHAYHHAVASMPWFGAPRLAARAREKLTFQEHPSYVGELVAYLRGTSAVPDPPGAQAAAVADVTPQAS